MDLQERIEALETEFADKIKTLKAEAQREDKFPQDGDRYWFIYSDGEVLSSEWETLPSEEHMFEVDNIFKTEDQAEFAVEKLKVETELRKFSRPFVWGEENWYLGMGNDKDIFLEYDNYEMYHGVTYFESEEKACQAIESVGRGRVKKYIFGVEE